MCRNCCHQLDGTNSGRITVSVVSGARSWISSMYSSSGPTSERYGDSTITSGTAGSKACHLRLNSSTASISSVMWTAVTVSRASRTIERA